MIIIIDGQDIKLRDSMTMKELAEWLEDQYPGKVLKCVTDDKDD